MNRQRPSLLVYLLVSWLIINSLPAHATPLAPPSLLKDVNDATANSYPGPFVDFKGSLYFGAGDKVQGGSLWKSDGTDAGTTLIKTFYQNLSESPFDKIIASTDRIYLTMHFTLKPENNLYQSDGTMEGTIQVSGIFTNVSMLGTVNNVLFFAANDAEHGRELWRTDGTVEGTYLLQDINPGVNNGLGFGNATVAGGQLYLSADNGSTTPFTAPDLLWKSDGTPAGTLFVKDVISDPAATNASIQSMQEINGLLYFTVYYAIGQNGFIELWSSDGSAANTIRVKQFLLPASGFGSPAYDYATLHTHNNGKFFIRIPGTAQLWMSDGTEGGTNQLQGFNWFSLGYRTASISSGFYFFATTGSGAELWKTDGTQAGTQQVKDIHPGGDALSLDGPIDLIAYQDRLFFSADDGIHGSELWRSDGSEAGTFLVKDINPYQDGSRNLYFDYHPIVVSNILFFAGYYSQAGSELWRSDGTADGTQRVKDINFFETGDACPSSFTKTDNGFFFMAKQGATGTELWKSDGTTEGTHLVNDFLPGSQSGVRNIYTGAGNNVYFAALQSADSASGNALWVSDGTLAGTAVVTTTLPEYTSFSPFSSILGYHGSFYFLSKSSFNGPVDFWRVDGTTMTLIKQFNMLSPYIYAHLISSSGTLYWSIDGGLWRSDGTSQGTTLVAQAIAAGLTEFQGKLYFVNTQGLWSSDGTSAGTALLKALSASKIVATSSQLLIKATDGLWRSDGTAEGTTLISTNWGEELVKAGERVYSRKVTSIGSTIEYSIWSSDGTTAGTQEIHKTASTSASSRSQYGFTSFNNLFFFVEQSTIPASRWLWRSDGTRDGTQQTFDLGTKNDRTGPDCLLELLTTPDRLYYSGNDGQSGIETWMIDSNTPLPIYRSLFLPVIQR